MHNNSTNWIDNKPFILLSIRNTLKEYISCIPAELVLDIFLFFPGELFENYMHTHISVIFFLYRNLITKYKSYNHSQ